MLLRNEGIETEAFLGITDSVVTFTILTKDSLETTAKIELSKHHGIKSFPHCDCLFENCSDSSYGSLYKVIGISTPYDTIGYKLPSRSDFSVINEGDEVLIKFRNSTDQSSYYPPTPDLVCHSSLKVDSLNETKDTLTGIITYYTDNFIYSNNVCIRHEQGQFASLNVIPIDFVRGLFGIDSYERIVWVKLYLIEDEELLESRWDGYGCDFSDITGYTEFTRFNSDFGRILHETSYTSNYRDYTTSIFSWVGTKTSAGILGYWPQNLGDINPIKSDIELWPNPANDVIQIESEQQIRRLQLFSVDGKQLSAEFERDKLDVSNLPNGIYILVFETDDEVESSRIFIRHCYLN